MINESSRFLRNLMHDIGLRLKSYALCQQIRRTKYGFVDHDSKNCLALNGLNLSCLLENNQALSEIAKDYIKTYDKTVVIGQTREDHEINKITPS